MLRIYPVSLSLVRDVGSLARRIEGVDRDLARQLRRSCSSIVLNLAEGSGSHGGTRRARYSSALGSARESLANLEVAEALGYVALEPAVRNRFDHVIGTLVRLVY